MAKTVELDQLNPTEQEKLNRMIDEAVTSCERQYNEKMFRKDVSDRAKDELGVATSDFNALVAERFESKATKNIEKYETIAHMNEILQNNSGAASVTTSDPEED